MNTNYASAIFGRINEDGYSCLQKSDPPPKAEVLEKMQRQAILRWGKYQGEQPFSSAYGHYRLEDLGLFLVWQVLPTMGFQPSRYLVAVPAQAYADFGYNPFQFRNAGGFQFGDAFAKNPETGICPSSCPKPLEISTPPENLELQELYSIGPALTTVLSKGNLFFEIDQPDAQSRRFFEVLCWCLPDDTLCRLDVASFTNEERRKSVFLAFGYCKGAIWEKPVLPPVSEEAKAILEKRKRQLKKQENGINHSAFSELNSRILGLEKEFGEVTEELEVLVDRLEKVPTKVEADLELEAVVAQFRKWEEMQFDLTRLSSLEGILEKKLEASTGHLIEELGKLRDDSDRLWQEQTECNGQIETKLEKQKKRLDALENRPKTVQHQNKPNIPAQGQRKKFFPSIFRNRSSMDLSQKQMAELQKEVGDVLEKRKLQDERIEKLEKKILTQEEDLIRHEATHKQLEARIDAFQNGSPWRAGKLIPLILGMFVFGLATLLGIRLKSLQNSFSDFSRKTNEKLVILNELYEDGSCWIADLADSLKTETDLLDAHLKSRPQNSFDKEQIPELIRSDSSIRSEIQSLVKGTSLDVNQIKNFSRITSETEIESMFLHLLAEREGIPFVVAKNNQVALGSIQAKKVEDYLILKGSSLDLSISKPGWSVGLRGKQYEVKLGDSADRDHPYLALRLNEKNTDQGMLILRGKGRNWAIVGMLGVQP